jgi:hypothetical protein
MAGHACGCILRPLLELLVVIEPVCHRHPCANRRR